MSTSIFYPVVVLVLWTFAVLLLVNRARIKAARAKQVRVADFAFGESENVPGEARLPNRNYMNLLEMPVLFYVACLVVYVIGKVDAWSLGLAWLYVALRVAHSIIHVTYNHVIHRMRAFALSYVVLVALWIRVLVVL
jgi:hypothetical protein